MKFICLELILINLYFALTGNLFNNEQLLFVVSVCLNQSEYNY